MSNSSMFKKVGIALILILAIFTAGFAYARYKEELVFDQGFTAKPIEQVAFGTCNWQIQDEKYILDFVMLEEVSNASLYVAVSQGVMVDEQFQVTLVAPGEEEPETYLASAEIIDSNSALHKTFGPGYVFRFYDAETGEPISFHLNVEETYQISIMGLQQATEYASLIRVFVESS